MAGRTEPEDSELTHPRAVPAPLLERSARRLAAAGVAPASTGDMGPMWLDIPAVDAEQAPAWLRRLRQDLPGRSIDNYAGECDPIVKQLWELGVRSRRLIFVGGSNRAQMAAAGRTKPGDELIDPGVRAGTADIEILDMRSPGLTAATAGRIRMPLGATVSERRDWPAMTIHQVDVALSTGRQAVERARLQQAALLIAQAIDSNVRNLIWGQPLQGGPSPYQTLRYLGRPEQAALTGAALAAAQLGLPLILAGPAARIAADLAITINAHAADWVLFPR